MEQDVIMEAIRLQKLYIETLKVIAETGILTIYPGPAGM
jgi:hypothetical protein